MRSVLLYATVVLAIGVARAQTAGIAASVSDEAGRPVEDAVVVAVPTDGGVRVPPRPREGIVDQVDQEFTPKVTAVLVGTPVRFPNHDNVRHQVYSFSPAKRFELPLYAGVPAEPVVFDKPGVVVLGCNIHDWMVGYVYVSESPYFAKTGKDGKALVDTRNLSKCDLNAECVEVCPTNVVSITVQPVEEPVLKIEPMGDVAMGKTGS